MQYRKYQNLVIFLACLIGISTVTIFIGAVPTHSFGHDTFFILDNGWRIINGQRPHVDYYSSWGPFYFLIVGLGLILSKSSVDGIGFANAIFGLIIGLWSYFICRNRFGLFSRLLLSLYLVGLVVAPYSLGFGALSLSHAMAYNRYGYALLCLIIIEAFQPNKRNKNEELLNGLSTGLATALSLFLKANYFIAAVILLSTSILSSQQITKRLLSIIISFFLVSFFFLLYLDFNFYAMIEDLYTAAGARSKSLFFSIFMFKFLTNTPYLIFSFLLSYYEYNRLINSNLKYFNLPLPLLSVVIYLVDIFILFTNYQKTELPLTIIFSFIIFTKSIANSKKNIISRNSESPYSRYVFFASTLFFLFSFLMQYSAIIFGASNKISPSNISALVRFKAPHLSPLILYDNKRDPNSNGSSYAAYINDGITLLSEKSNLNESILTMDMMNPFSYTLKRIPPLGGVAAAAYNYTLSDNFHPSEKKFFGSAKIVMVPKRPASPSIFYDGFFKIYENALHQRYSLVAESDYWYLYRRK
jgi:hypothetical protein